MDGGRAKARSSLRASCERGWSATSRSCASTGRSRSTSRLGLTGPRDLAVAGSRRGHRSRTDVADRGGRPAGQRGRPPSPSSRPGATRRPESSRAAEEHRCDLIVMGAESRHGWGRIAHPPVASRVARHAFGVPVVFVPAPAPDQSPARGARGFSPFSLPTDLSPAGNRAVPFAYALVAAHGGVVELCHVHERAAGHAGLRRTIAPRASSAPRSGRASRVPCARSIPAEAERLGITTHVTVIDGGKAAEAIAQAAERLVVDAIVLGSHGKGGAAGLLLGSVSQSVVHRARRPVLVVPSALTDGSRQRSEGRNTP